MGIEDMFEQRCSIYHLEKTTVNMGYGITSESMDTQAHQVCRIYLVILILRHQRTWSRQKLQIHICIMEN